jgi:hypothetical protein
MVKFKDAITNVCGFIVTVGGAVLVSGLDIGEKAKLVIGLAVAVAGGVIGFLTGKSGKDVANG